MKEIKNSRLCKEKQVSKANKMFVWPKFALVCPSVGRFKAQYESSLMDGMQDARWIGCPMHQGLKLKLTLTLAIELTLQESPCKQTSATNITTKVRRGGRSGSSICAAPGPLKFAIHRSKIANGNHTCPRCASPLNSLSLSLSLSLFCSLLPFIPN